MHTKKIYFDDSYTVDFEANILKVQNYKDKYAVILDKTAFYPESGGQPADKGSINGIKVVDVIEEDQAVLHIIESPFASQKAVCSIDWERRIDHMQQHTGQHILSACFYKLYGGNTSSFHIGSDYATIEIDITEFNEDMAAAIEDMANKAIYANLPVYASIVDPETLQKLPLRKMPRVESNIRIVEIEDFDFSPCGGTHVKSTGEIGIIKIRRWEKLKSSYKFEFVCGMRALTDYRLKNAAIYYLGAAMSVRDAEVITAFDKLNDSLSELQKQCSILRNELLDIEAGKNMDNAEEYKEIKIITKLYEKKDINDVKLMAQNIVKNPSFIVLMAAVNNAVQAVFARSEDVDLDASSLLKKVLPIINGRGGGSPKLAQGGGEITKAAQEFITKAREHALEQL
ncbi:MAG: alanyl-tRNA editing protein [Bacillota bacterium]